MAQENRTTATRGRTALFVLIGILVLVAIVYILRGVDEAEPENVYGAPTAGADLTPDASPAPPEGAEGAAGIVSVPPDSASSQGGEADAAGQ